MEGVRKRGEDGEGGQVGSTCSNGKVEGGGEGKEKKDMGFGPDNNIMLSLTHPIVCFNKHFARAAVEDHSAVLPFFLPLGQALRIQAGPVLDCRHARSVRVCMGDERVGDGGFRSVFRRWRRLVLAIA